ncbi:MAG TPA: pitrilysin family protein [Polyangia bacterium]|nr:pitrilysin family protein [Polyangia bacterium]
MTTPLGKAQLRPHGTAPATASSLPAPKLDVKSWSLANGLQVLFLADHKAPIATVQVFYHVGSKNEHVGIRGVAHMFEHMMFKGSAHVPPEEHARLLKEVGGQVNAFTTEDVTAYHDTVPPSYVGFALELEAERMRNLKLFQSTIDSERKVVEEEKRLRVDNDPVGKAIERFRALAYTTHPYNWTAIGTIEDLDKVTPADCQRFYDAFYQPNNATLIIVGDLDEQATRKLVDQYFGPIPHGPDQPRKIAQEPPQTSARAATMQVEVQIPIIVGGYHIPRASDPDMPALEVLAAVLSAGESSRLTERLVRHDHLAIAAGGVTESLEDPGLFIVYAAFLPNKDASKIDGALAEEIARVRDKPIAPDELDKAKNQAAAGFVFGLETVDGIAQRLGEAQYIEGDWHRFIEGATRYLAVTAADVQRVARKYLVDTNLTRVTLVPPGVPMAPPTPAPKTTGGKP